MLALLLAVSAGAAAPSLRLPPHQRVRLDNGLTLLLMEQHEVPLINFHVLVRAGGTADPTGREGLAFVTANLLRRGTQTRSAEQIASELDFVGGTMDVQTDVDRAIVVAEVLKKDLAVGLGLLADVLRKPSFPPDEVALLQRQKIDAIKQAKEETREVLPRYFYAALFGEHPYGRSPLGTETTLAAVTRDDVVTFHRRHYTPENTIVAVVGDFAADEMRRALTQKFSEWPRGSHSLAPLAAPTPTSGRKVVLVNKPDAAQTFFVLGHVGIARDHPDRTGLELVNVVFGGRFTSMLNEALRINSGLTYGASSQFARHRVAGPFFIASFTQTASTEKALDLTLEVLAKLHAEGLSATALQSAKDYIKGQFPPRLETTDKLASLLADLEFYGLDEREVNDLFARLDAFSAADARRLIDRHFPQKDWVLVLIGKADEIERVAKKYSPQLERLEISAPGFSAAQRSETR